MLRFYLLPFILFYSTQNLYSQYTNFRKEKIDWKRIPIKNLQLNESFKNEDAVFLFDTTLYFIHSEVNISTSISRHYLVKILTEEGKKKFCKLLLPESLDLDADDSNIPYEKRDSIDTPQKMDISVGYISARIIKKNKRVIEPVVHNKILPLQYLSHEIDKFYQSQFNDIYKQNRNIIEYKKYFNYLFWIDEKQVEIGDEIEIAYNYSMSDLEYPKRVFFHANYPKQICNATFIGIGESNGKNVYYYAHKIKPDFLKDTSITDIINQPITTYTLKNLHGLKNKSGSRLYKDLPYITFYKNVEHFGLYDISSPTSPEGIKLLPYTWEYALKKYYISKGQFEREQVRLMMKDKNTLALSDFFKAHSLAAEDTFGIETLAKIHRYVNDSLNYKSRYQRFLDDDYRPTTTSIGAYLSKGYIYQDHRQEFYHFMFLSLSKAHYVCLIPDNRIFNISPDVYTDQHEYHFGYCILLNNKPVFYMPKTSRFGYEVNEFPFYLEASNAIIVNQYPGKNSNVSDTTGRGSVLFAKTFSSHENNNTRTTSSIVNINIKNSSANFETKLMLSGQFSTMTRRIYLYDDKDSSVNPLYHKKVYEIGNKHHLVNQKLTSRLTQFPFNANFRFSYISHDCIVLSDTSITINIHGWLKHITNKQFTTQNRHLNFYPDFKSHDKYKYILKFESPVQLQSKSNQQIDISNEFGKYQFSIKQTSETEIEVESYHAVLTDMVPAEKTKFVKDIFKAIENSENAIIEVLIKK